MTIYELRYVNDMGSYETDSVTCSVENVVKRLMAIAGNPRLFKRWFVRIWYGNNMCQTDMCRASAFLVAHHDPYATYVRLLDDNSDAPITDFSGPMYRFLGNFSKYSVTIDGLTYPTSENAYQALKYHDKEVRKQFTTLSPEAAMILGRAIVPWTHISDEQRLKT